MARGGYRPGAGRTPNPLSARQQKLSQRVGVTQVRDALIKEDRKLRQAAELQPMTQVSPAIGGKFRTTDAFVNYTHKIGLGADNILTSSTASFIPLSRYRVILEWMYRQQFVCKNACDVVAEDMTRQGVDITGPMLPKNIRKIERGVQKLGIWSRLRSLIKWSRLYGGCLAVIIIKGQKLEDPLNLETVGPGQFKGLKILDRWMVDPSLELLVTDMSDPACGLPTYYRVTADAPALPRMKIHHSRVIRMGGVELPYWQAVQENLWGLSILETIQDRIASFDLGSAGAAQLIDKSFIRTFHIEGLKELLGSNTIAYEGVRQYMQAVTSFQGIEGVTLLDTKDEYKGNEHGAFSGLAEILQEFRQQLSGALMIPQTKLFGTSPAGMNATGESDMRNYYDLIKARQVTDLLDGLMIVYQLVAQSIGVEWDDEAGLEFKPLWQPTEVEKAEIAGKITETVLKAEEQGTISPECALKELKQQSRQTGVFSNITEKDIKTATDVPVPAASIVMPGEGGPAGKPPGGAPKPAPAKGKPPAGKPAPKKAKDSYWTGTAGGAEINTTFGSDPDHKPNILLVPDEMPSGVMPGARPFDDAANTGQIHGIFHGLPIHLENERGTTRHSRDPSNPWQAIMAADYGYIVGSSSAEGPTEGLDVFLGPDIDSDTVYVISQKDLTTGEFDEHKCMLGFGSGDKAVSAYVSSYSDLQGMSRIMSIKPMFIDTFKHWVAHGDMTKEVP
jgi:uncharacterized protein